MVLLSHSTNGKTDLKFKTLKQSIRIHMLRYLVRNNPFYKAFGQTNHSIFVLYLILCGMLSY